MLAFEPVTSAIGLFLFENTCRTRPHRLIPRARVLFKRFEDVFREVAVNEAAEPLLDRVVNAVDPRAVLVLAMILVLHRIVARRVFRSQHTQESEESSAS
jgi:hypothetical protein